jgi:hypothetical protein
MNTRNRIAGALLFMALASPAQAPAQMRHSAHEWGSLSASQQEILSPLRVVWGTLDESRRAKWLRIAKRYPSMKRSDRERLQRRMLDWAKLSARERTAARARYRQLNALPPERRLELITEWQRYQERTGPQSVVE